MRKVFTPAYSTFMYPHYNSVFVLNIIEFEKTKLAKYKMLLGKYLQSKHAQMCMCVF